MGSPQCGILALQQGSPEGAFTAPRPRRTIRPHPGGAMPDFDLAIRGGTIATAADVFRADIGVRDGRIVTVADRVESAARIIDASGLLVLPGGIDSHIHVSQPSGPGIVMADDFAS